VNILRALYKPVYFVFALVVMFFAFSIVAIDGALQRRKRRKG
jgi:hypothetical protein